MISHALFAQSITYDGSNRIASVADLLVAGTTYDVTVTYGIAIGGASLGNGDISDANLAAAINAIAALNVGSSTGDLDSIVFFGQDAQSGNGVDPYVTIGRINRDAGVPSLAAVVSSENVFVPAAASGANTSGIAVFTAVPEPTSFALAGALSLGAFAYRRRRKSAHVVS